MISAFSKKEKNIFDVTSNKKKKKEEESLKARQQLQKYIDGTLQLNTEDKISIITKAFTQKDQNNRPASDMMDATIVMLLNRYKQRENTETEITGEDLTTQQKEEEYRDKLKTLLQKHEGKDNDCPDTETDSQIDTNELSGSEEEVIDYSAPNNCNRDDLPMVPFNYKNKEHVGKVLEAARSMIF